MAITGDWKLTLQTPFGVQTPTLRIKADGSAAMVSPLGEIPVLNLKLGDDTAEFTANIPTPMGSFEIGFEVKAAGDALTGAFTSPLGATQIEGVREA
jgi:hypothetical protein